MSHRIFKIAITGPESTGKSDLSHFLADFFDEPVVPEFAREYLLKKGNNYSLTDLVEICKGQIKLEEKALSQAKEVCFFDTDMLVLEVWSEFRFGEVPQIIHQNLLQRNYDLYLLCNTDLPWEEDPLRESPRKQERDLLYSIYKNKLDNMQANYLEVSGVGETRIQNALKAVKMFLSTRI